MKNWFLAVLFVLAIVEVNLAFLCIAMNHWIWITLAVPAAVFTSQRLIERLLEK